MMSSRLAIVVVVVAGAFITAAAAAADGDHVGPELGLRGGYSLPTGTEHGGVSADAQGVTPMTAQYSGRVPFWIDLGYRIVPNLAVGAFFHYDIVVPSGTAGALCQCGAHIGSGQAETFGVEMFYHALPRGPIDPWAGVGFGYERTTLLSTAGLETSESLRGWELLNIQIGADYKPTPALGIGPFAAFSLGEYSIAYGDSSPPRGSVSMDLYTKTFHEWFTLGVRGIYDVRL